MKRFQLVGGDPALDFINTISDWTTQNPGDHIGDFGDAVAFGEQCRLLTRAEARRLSAHGGATEVSRVRALRALLERVFRAPATGVAPRGRELDQLGRLAAEVARVTRLRSEGGSVIQVIDAEAAGAALLRWRIVQRAVELLTSQRIERLKACPNCGWLFLDLSKNRSRRWCSMDDCGSRLKARRYYHRRRGRNDS